MNVKSQHTGQVKTDRLERRNRETLSEHLGMAAVIKEAKGQIELRPARISRHREKLTKENMSPLVNRAEDSLATVTDHSRSPPRLSFITRKFSNGS